MIERNTRGSAVGTYDDAAVSEVDIDTWQEKGMNQMEKRRVGLYAKE